MRVKMAKTKAGPPRVALNVKGGLNGFCIKNGRLFICGAPKKRLPAFLRRAALAAAAASAITISAVAQGATISCASSPITAGPLPNPDQLKLHAFTDIGDAHGGFVFPHPPSFEADPNGCPGFRLTDFTFFYLSDPADNSRPITIITEIDEPLSFPGALSPLVGTSVSADGKAAFASNDFTLSNIMVDSFVDDDRPQGAFAQTGLVNPGSTFSTASDHSGTAELRQSGDRTLRFELEILLMQGNTPQQEMFSISFPRSLDSVVVPVTTPEPGTLVLLVSALGGFAAMVRCNRRLPARQP